MFFPSKLPNAKRGKREVAAREKENVGAILDFENTQMFACENTDFIHAISQADCVRPYYIF